MRLCAGGKKEEPMMTNQKLGSKQATTKQSKAKQSKTVSVDEGLEGPVKSLVRHLDGGICSLSFLFLSCCGRFLLHDLTDLLPCVNFEVCSYWAKLRVMRCFFTCESG
jgi:hypothetical protein